MKFMWTYIVSSAVVIISYGNERKRFILDNDQTTVKAPVETVQERLNRMENLLVVLNNTVKQQTQTIHYQSTILNQQARTIQSQNSTLQRLEGNNKLLEDALLQLQNTTGSGTTYIIWGRKQCPATNSTEQIYSGYAGGGKSEHKGAAVEYVCLPPDPDFQSNSSSGFGYMYGAEYQAGPFGADTEDKNVPCAVCRNIHASSTLMIPGKNHCYAGWTNEYHGYLASGAIWFAAASSYVCVDSQPEYLNVSSTDHDGKYFYGVLAQCGSLQCPPYIDKYPLTCVVCSK